MGSCLRKGDAPLTLNHLSDLIHSNVETSNIIEYIDLQHITNNTFKQEEKYYGNVKHPMEWAIKAGNVQLVRDLIVHRGFSAHRSEKQGSKAEPIHVACTSGSLEIVTLLVEKFGVSLTTINGNCDTPLSLAIMANRKDIVAYIVQKGVELNIKVKKHSLGLSYLHTAVITGNPEICSVLLSNGAHLDARDFYGNTPLHEATKWLRFDCCRLLIEAGADVNLKNLFGHSPMHFASDYESYKNQDMRKYKQVLNLLISHGADPNSVDYCGNTPLHIAIWYSELARFLIINQNVEMGRKNYSKETPFSSALTKDLLETAELMLQVGYRPAQEECADMDARISSDRLCCASDRTSSFLSLLTHVRRNAPTLQQICVTRIRQQLGTRLMCTVESLPVPVRLKEMISLKSMCAII